MDKDIKYYEIKLGKAKNKWIRQFYREKISDLKKKEELAMNEFRK